MTMRPLRYGLASLLMVLLSVGPAPMTQTTTVNVEREQTITGKKHFTGGFSVDTCTTDPPSGACSPSGTSHDFCVDDTNNRIYGCIGAAWVNLSSAAGGTPGGSSTQVQFNSGGSFAGDSGMVFTAASDLLTVGNVTVSTNAKFPGGNVPATGYTRFFLVDKAGHGRFTTINSAVTAAAQTAGGCTEALPCVIGIMPGTYTDMVHLGSGANHLTLGVTGDVFDNIHFVGLGSTPDEVIWKTTAALIGGGQTAENPVLGSCCMLTVSTATSGTRVQNLTFVDDVTTALGQSFYSTDTTNASDTIMTNVYWKDTGACDSIPTYVCSRGKLRMFNNIIEKTTSGTSSAMCFAANIDADCDYEVDGNTYVLKGDKLGIWQMIPSSAGNNGRYRFVVRNVHGKITNPANVNNAEYKVLLGSSIGGAAYDSLMQIRSSLFEIEPGTIATATVIPYDWQINLDPSGPVTGLISNGLELYDVGTRVNGEAVTTSLTATGYNIDSPGSVADQETRLHLHDTQMAIITNTAIAGTRNGMNLDTESYYSYTVRPSVHMTGDNVISMTHGTADIAYAGTAAESDFHLHDGWFGKWSKQLIPPTQSGAISGACTGLGGVRTRNTDGSASISVCDSAGQWETVVGTGDSVSVDGGTVVDPNFDDGGDINFATTGSPATVTATVKANSVALTTDTTGDYVASVAAGTALDVTGAGEGAAVTVALDTTEIGNTTFGSGSGFAFTFDSGATDPVFTFASALTDISTALTATSFTADDPGDNSRGIELTDNTTNCADPAAGNTSICAIGGIPRMRDTGGSTIPIATGSGVSTHGVVYWGDQDDASFDTGTEVCAARGLTCVGAAEIDGTELATCGTAATGSATGWFLAFCR